MNTDKKGVSQLVDICVKKGISKVVISPGSRNAPLTIAFSGHPDIECFSVADERSAAFFALGMAQQLKTAVAIACTSGSAALNYAPAIAEAFYQRVPLLVLTADRPEEWTDQGDGQTIRQQNVYANHILKSFQLPQEPADKDRLWHSARIVSEAIDTCTFPIAGPVHINLPFREPLYGQADGFGQDETKVIRTVAIRRELEWTELERLAAIWRASEKKLLLCGMMPPNEALSSLLEKVTQDPSVVVMTETTSNLNDPRFFPCIDKVVDPLPENKEAFQPHLLITFGGPIVSKKIKAFLRENQPISHWHVDSCDHHLDTFQSLTENIPVKAESFFTQLVPFLRRSNSDYYQQWKHVDTNSEAEHLTFLQSAPWSDLKVFETLLEHLPQDSQLQLGNSTPVRYAQLFKSDKAGSSFANRGTSGIDGATSTAVGSAIVSQEMVTIITGDVGFFYDSNALWNKHLPGNLRIIVINNGGGAIFKIIPGPDTTDALDTFFETKHNWKAKGIAETFGVHYSSASNEKELKSALKDFFDPKNERPSLLEIFTQDADNAKVLKDYFKALKANK